MLSLVSRPAKYYLPNVFATIIGIEWSLPASERSQIFCRPRIWNIITMRAVNNIKFVPQSFATINLEVNPFEMYNYFEHKLNFVNKQTLFTVKYARSRVVKLYHAIWVYFH